MPENKGTDHVSERADSAAEAVGYLLTVVDTLCADRIHRRLLHHEEKVADQIDKVSSDETSVVKDEEKQRAGHYC